MLRTTISVHVLGMTVVRGQVYGRVYGQVYGLGYGDWVGIPGG